MDLENKKIFFSPHPSRDFGLARTSIWSKAECKNIENETIFKLKEILRTFSRIPLGIQERDIQYTSISSSIDFTRARQLALDNHQKHQFFKNLSNFTRSQCDSFVK